MNREYSIRTVADFSLIPADKIGDCLADFSCWLGFVRKMETFPEPLANELAPKGASISINGRLFIWVDDGVSGISSVQFSDSQGRMIGRVGIDGIVEAAQ